MSIPGWFFRWRVILVLFSLQLNARGLTQGTSHARTGLKACPSWSRTHGGRSANTLCHCWNIVKEYNQKLLSFTHEDLNEIEGLQHWNEVESRFPQRCSEVVTDGWSFVVIKRQVQAPSRGFFDKKDKSVRTSRQQLTPCLGSETIHSPTFWSLGEVVLPQVNQDVFF